MKCEICEEEISIGLLIHEIPTQNNDEKGNNISATLCDDCYIMMQSILNYGD